ncbi:unnamed protein product (macronuclear) [Paramecium tetraurelia]|uniref:Translin-associated factor X-interacting protein 1 N-terminal domain-containing protein n=1 Tax=Paramecium tetraurelia TaxID=5888 RepID=A0CML9_PARTE|nr:uncharacterized protein GSPATT00008515001 [Paramecium tetraurelia]CAK72036.1 unnamed protein product [Paramecium tetraurelia]|eukprot:XP_001439433.1 hypothetical protein (macronuclear) [Paramecium tetraurelia strain d4-2]
MSVHKSPKNSILSTARTRPQTALTSPRVPQVIQIPNDDQDQQTQINKCTATTSLTPKSLIKLQERKTNVGGRPENLSCNLRVTKEQAEIDPPEDYFEKEVQVNQDEYEQFKKNFHRIVFDAFGNYIYTKPGPIDEDFKLQVSSALNTHKQTSSTLKQKLQIKTQSFQPKKTIENLVKSTSEIAKMNPRRRAILEIKQKAENSLYQMINNLAKDKVLSESKSLLEQVTQQMLIYIDKFTRENQELTDQLEMAKGKIFELQSSNESLNFKNIQLLKEIKNSKHQLDELKRSTVDIEKFIPQYNIMTKRFENFQAEKFIDRYDYFENSNLLLTKRVSDLELDTIQLEKQIVHLQKDLETNQQINKHQYDTKLHSPPHKQDLPNQDYEQYKDMYLNLFKKILQIYSNWTTKSKALLPDKMDEGPRANLVEPLEMLQNIEKMISISSNEKLQSYLRKIIVSANQLQRKYLTENVNEKFDPDKIYGRISKLVDNLKAQISNLQSQVQSYKQSQNCLTQLQTQRSKSFFHEKEQI